MGPPVREGYNKKGRQSSGGKRKKGKVKKRKTEDKVDEDGALSAQVADGGGHVQHDPNAEILVPKSKEEKELERKAKMLKELQAQTDAKWTQKKKKRLEKYIEKKLKKEERLVIFEKLAQSQASLSSAALQSSSMLGSRKILTHQELLDKQEDKAVKDAITGRTSKKRKRNPYAVYDAEQDEDEDEELERDISDHEMDSISPQRTAKQLTEPTVTMDLSGVHAKPEKGPIVVGSALQRNPDGSIVQPKMRPMKKKQISKKGWGIQSNQEEDMGDSDTSFDSSDSAYDSSSDEEASNQDRMEVEKEGSSSESDSSDDDEGGDEGSDSDHVEDDQLAPPAKKKLAFKDWAKQQLSAAKPYLEGESQGERQLAPNLLSQPVRKKPRLDPSQPREMIGPLGEQLQFPESSFAKHVLDAEKASAQASSSSKAPKAFSRVVEITRPADVEEARLLLPIVTEEQPIMEAIMLNPVVIICGETGSGKTTQVPQFLYEAGFGTPGNDNPGMIGITQPRRVAAMSMASRVGHELSLTSSKVSYQIRYDATVSPDTSIKFMTDGVLLRELATDFLLTKYSVIIIDEAHERSINTDILIGVLSRVIKLREERWKEKKEGAKPLRLIIMSATLRVSDFAENKALFSKPPPVISVGGRTHPVTVHFSRRTSPDYVNEAIKKTAKIHSRLPPGGILIFLTGQNEITGVCKKLEARFGKKALEAKKMKRAATSARWTFDKEDEERQQSTANPAQVALEVEDIELGADRQDEDLADDVDGGMTEDDPDALDTDEEDEELNESLGLEETEVPMHIVPLYSLLPSDKQMKVFEPPPPGHRLVVVSTNVAETSLTIPGIRYVVDCGRVKERKYDSTSGVQSFQIAWTSKASAQQRAGRAGRTGPGHCYRLYSSALYENHFEQFSEPEILRTPIEGIVLQMKNMHIDTVVNFPFPTPPERLSLQKAERTLIHLGALAADAKAISPVGSAKITDLGRAMALFPIAPRFARMLVSGQQHGCLPYVISVVSALSVGDPFLFEESLNEMKNDDDDDEETDMSQSEAKRARRKAFFQSQHLHSSLGKRMSDIFKSLSVVGAYEYSGGGHKFCADHFVRLKAMEEIHKLRAQIGNIVRVNFPASDPKIFDKLPPPSDFQLKVLRQLLAASFIDQVAIRKDRIDNTSSSRGAQFANSKGIPYRAVGIPEDVFIHPSSVLIDEVPPEFVVFHELVRTSKPYMKGVTVVNPAWLAKLGKPLLCTFSKPVRNKEGVMMVIPRFGPHGWELPAMKADST